MYLELKRTHLVAINLTFLLHYTPVREGHRPFVGGPCPPGPIAGYGPAHYVRLFSVFFVYFGVFLSSNDRLTLNPTRRLQNFHSKRTNK